MSFDPWILFTFGFLCVLGIINNIFSFVYVVRELKEVQRSLFFLLLADSLISIFGIAIFLIICICLYLGFINELLCSALFMALHMPSLIGAVSTAQIAVIRYVSLLLSIKLKKPDDNLLLCINVFLVSFLFFVEIVVGILHIQNNYPMAIISETCLNDENQRSFLIVTKLYGIIPLISSLIVSVAFDYLILRFLTNAIHPEPYNQDDQTSSSVQLVTTNFSSRSYEVIPARATLFSSLMLIPYICIAVAVSMHAQMLGTKAAIIIGIIALILNGCRFPMAALVTFAGKKETKTKEPKLGPQQAEVMTLQNLS